MGYKSDLKLAEHSSTKELSHENNRTIESAFSTKDVSYDFSYSHQVSVLPVDYSRRSR